MGADLAGHICVGPREPSAETITKAREHAIRVLAQVEEARALIKKEGTTVVTRVIENSQHFSELVAAAQRVDCDNDLVDFIESSIIGQYGPDEFVTEFLNMWEHREKYRDVMSRDFIDPQSGVVDSDFQILVVGERSWGDGPCKGTAWWLCKHADWLGIMDILGIY